MWAAEEPGIMLGIESMCRWLTGFSAQMAADAPGALNLGMRGEEEPTLTAQGKPA